MDVGTLDDPPSRPGLAHLIEHLILGSAAGARIPLARQLETLGGVANGFTKLDRTIFSALLPRAALPAALSAMSERFARAGALVDDALLANQRAVVAEEDRLRQGIEGSAGARLALAAVAGSGQPWSRLAQDVDPAALAAVSVADVRRFLEEHYRPDRMTLAIAGELSRGAEHALIAALPVALKGTGALGRVPVRRRIGPGEPPVIPSGEIASHPTAVSAPELWMAWSLPPVRALDAVPFECLANVVGQVLSDRLRDGELPDALRVGCTTVESTLGGGLICRVQLKRPAAASAVRTRLLGDVGSLAHLLDLSLGKTRTYATLLVHGSLLASAFDFESMARRTIVRANLMHDDPNADLSEVMRGIGKLTPQMVAALAGQYLRPETSRAVLLLPDAGVARRAVGRQTGEEVPTDPPATDEGGPQLDAGDDVPDVRGIARPLGAAAAQTARLANGLTVVALRRPGFASVSMVLGFHADPQPGDAAGAAPAAFLARSHPTLPNPIWSNLLYDPWRTTDAYAESISTLSSNLPAAFEHLARETQTLSVRWPAAAYDRWVERAVLASGTPAHRADMAFTQELWAEHPYAHRLTREQARQVTEPQVRRWLDRVFRPANGTLIVVGDVDPDEVLKTAADRLSDWSGEPGAPPPPPVPPARPPQRPMPVLRTEDATRDLFRIRFGCFLPSGDTARDGIAGDVV
ncbi:MAG TPA: insulinase family protein, partial [Polyangia bacterium]|nr:insulinase family protein [Polyangia bacterium]